jgi:hypothetical protein
MADRMADLGYFDIHQQTKDYQKRKEMRMETVIV